MYLDKAKYENIAQEMAKIAEGIVPTDEFCDHIKNKLAAGKPTLMIYGVYNAGKSTLLNALFGKELAKTGDAPETSKIAAYEYQGFTVYDTPGINAPKEHEEVTEVHLKKCEVVVFALSNQGAFEAVYNYDTIAKVIKLGKPVLVALNNKTGTELDSEHAVAEVDTVNQHLIKMAKKYAIDEGKVKEIKVITVNANAALKAKLEDKPLLLEASNIGQLEAAINTLLKEAGPETISQSLDNYVKDFIITCSEAIDKQIDNEALQKAEATLTKLGKMKDSLKLDLGSDKQELVGQVERAVENAVLSDQDPNKEVKGLVDSFSEMLNSKVKDKQQEITDLTGTAAKEINTLIEEVGVEAGAGADDDIAGSQPDKSPPKSVTPITTALAAASSKIPHPIGKYLAGMLAVAGPIFDAIRSFFSDDGQAQQQQAQENMQRKAMLAKNTAANCAYKLGGQIEGAIAECIAIFNEPIAHFTKLKAQLGSANDDMSQKKQALTTISDSL